jgi:hypothetical protein
MTDWRGIQTHRASLSISAASTDAAPARAQAMAAIPPPAAKSSTRLPATSWMVQDVPRERLPARPGEGPEWRLDIALGQPGFGGLPDRRDLGGQMQPDFRHQRRRRRGRCWRG